MKKQNKFIFPGLYLALLICGSLLFNNGFAKASSLIPYSISGTYVGDGTASHAITGLDFTPEVVIIKSGAANTQAVIRASTMGGTVEMAPAAATGLIANTINSLDLDGFTVGDDSRVNSDGVSYYWVAFKTDEGLLEMMLGTYDGNGNPSQEIFGLKFLPSYLIVINNSGATAPKHRSDTMTWGHSFYSEATNLTTITSFNTVDPENDEYTFTVGNSLGTNAIGSTYTYIAWKAMPGRMNTGFYTGTGVNDKPITGIGFQPEILWLTPESAAFASDWRTATSPAGDSTMSFNVFGTSTNQIKSLTNDGFTVGTHPRANNNFVVYRWMAWARVEHPNITTASLPDGEVTLEYSQQLEATGGDGTYTWLVSAGTLPDGLELDNETGIISGTATASGTFNFTIGAISSDEPIEKTFSITIDPAPSIITSSLPDGKVKMLYSQTLSAAGGSENYTTWTLSSGSLPNNVALNNVTGVISGKPTTAGVSNFSITVTDSNGAISSPANFSITVKAVSGAVPLSIGSSVITDNSIIENPIIPLIPPILDQPQKACDRTLNAPFIDISNSSAKAAIQILYKDCIIDGRHTNQFSPKDYITKAEFTKMLVRTAKLDLAQYENFYQDVMVGDWFAEYVATAVKFKILPENLENMAQKLFYPHQVINFSTALDLILKTTGIDLADSVKADLNAPFTRGTAAILIEKLHSKLPAKSSS